MIRAKYVYLFLYFPLLLVALMASAAIRREFYAASVTRHLAAVVVLLLVVFGSLHKRSVSYSAVPVIFFFGYIICMTSGVYVASVVGFLIVGSRVTKVGSHIKNQFQQDYKPEGRRRWNQVVSNSGVTVVLCLLTLATVGHGEHPVDFNPLLGQGFYRHRYRHPLPSPQSLLGSYFHLGILGAVACCCGDTFSSELGPVYAHHAPVLITRPWRRVPIGTNGGITWQGVLFGGLGGAVQGLIHYLFTIAFCHSPSSPWPVLVNTQLPLVLLGLCGGLIGSLVDSVLGATLQFSGVLLRTNQITDDPDGFDVKQVSGLAVLDNDLVNFLASLITAGVIPLVAHASVGL